MRGCEVGTDGRLLRWYDQMAYDGVDCLTQNEDLSSGTATSIALAQISQDNLGTHLKGKCVKLLQKHLEKGKDTLLRSGAPEAIPYPSFPQATCWEFGELGVHGQDERTWGLAHWPNKHNCLEGT